MVRGILTGACVCVYEQDHASNLYEDGCFGKGILSRGKPCYFSATPNAGTKRSRGGGDIRGAADVRGQRMEFHTKAAEEQPQYSDLRQQRIVSVELTHRIEPLQLSLEEAFYLMDVEDRLSVHVDSHSDSLTGLQCWRAFVDVMGVLFVYRYVAYCHYRRANWTVRSGLKYGTDFVLYHRSGPSRFHAQYAVCLQAVSESDLSAAIGGTSRFSSFRCLQALSRVTEQVAKGLVVCNVVRPAHLSAGELAASPACLPAFNVYETRVARLDPCKLR